MKCERIYRGNVDRVIVAVVRDQDGTPAGPGRYHVISWKLPENGPPAPSGDPVHLAPLAGFGAWGSLTALGTFCYHGAAGGTVCSSRSDALTQASDLAKFESRRGPAKS